RAALVAKDPALRRNGIRALGNDSAAQMFFAGTGAVSDPDPVTRLAALVKLAEFPTTKEIQTLVLGLSRDPKIQGDEWLGQAAKLLRKRHKAQPYIEGPNLLPNPGFETAGADGLPEGWTRRDYGKRPGNAKATWEIVTGEDKV